MLVVFKQVVNLAPDSFRGYANLGAAYYQLNRYPEAISAFSDSENIRPNYQAASNLGTVLFFSGDYRKAAEAFETAVKFRDRDYRLWAYLASAERWAGRPEAAKAAFQRSAELGEESRRINPQDAKVLSILADDYGNLGDLKNAADLIQQALMIAPEDASVLFRAANIYEDVLHDRPRAFTLLSRALARGYDRAEVDRTPVLAKLRSDPKFKSLQTQ